MSTLEERREARRRRRQMEEEEDDIGVVTSPEDSYNLEKRRQEREDRLQRIAAGFSTINGEDELERRRRERREQRLRSGTTETPDEDTSSRRSRRRRGTEDEVDTGASEEYTSTRSRRRRGQEEESESAPAPEPEPEPQVNAGDDERRRQEEEEEAERQRKAAEAARRRAEEEEEDRRRQEEEDRRQREAEEKERRRREEEDEAEFESRSESGSDSEMADYETTQGIERDEHERKIDEQLQRLKSLEKDNDLLLNEDEWADTSSRSSSVRRKSDERGKIISPKEPVRRTVTDYSLRTTEDGKCGKLKSFFEEKTEHQINGDHRETPKSLNFSKKPPGNTSIDDSSPVHSKLKKFENNQQTKVSQKVTMKDLAVYQAKVISPGPSRLKDIQKKFEDKNSIDNTSSRLGRLSVSESHLNDKPGTGTDNKKHILDRWQAAVETKKPAKQTSWLSKSMNTSYDFELNKKGDKIERLTSKFDHNRNEKPDKFLRSATLPLNTNRDVSFIKRQWSQTTENSSYKDENIEQKKMNRHSVPKITEQWLQKTQTSEESISPYSTRSETRTRPTSASIVENHKETSSGQFSHAVRRKSSTKSEEEERLERERLEAEEREREEAARIMEEQQKKKKGKRKGLGGLSPEKKKMLKKLIMQKAAEDLRNEAKAKAEEKEKYINERVGALSLEGKAEGDLVKLCKNLHSKLSQLEEEVYDWEVKIRKQDAEIIQLTLKVNDSKGKFAKPVLKKVNKTESKLNKIGKKDKADFRDNLKSSGQSKFALDEEGEEKK